MEVNKKSGSEEMLNRMWTLSAGLTAIALAVGLVVTIALKPPSQTGQFSAEMLYYAAMLAIAAGMGLCGFGLIRRRVWAQQTMLVFCLTVTAGAVVTLVSALIWEEWWTQTTTSTIGSGAAWMLMIGVLIGAVAMDAMLILASQWRLRYASIVSVSAAAAIALAVIVNVISQRDFHRVPVESLGRYSISERTERIISDLDEPIRLTCVYTGTSEGKRGAEFRPRLWELMEDIREKGYKLGKKIEIASVTTDAERKAEDTRLGMKQRGRGGAEHEQFIQNFQTAAIKINQQLRGQQNLWRDMSKDAYLSQWPIPAPLAVQLARLIEGFDRTRIHIRSEMDNEGIRNYQSLVAMAKSILTSTHTSLNGYRTTLAALEQVHIGAVKNRAAAMAAVEQNVRDVNTLIQIVGKRTDPPPTNPSAVINAIVKASAKIADSANKATTALETLAGKDHATLVVNSSHWVIKGKNKTIPLSEFFGEAAKGFMLLARRNQQIAQISTQKFKTEEIIRMRTKLSVTQVEFGLAGAAAEQALKALATSDEMSRKVMKDASENILFKELIAEVDALIKQADKLPPLKATSLTKDLAGDNIVIVEAGDKTEVVGFDEVWPLGLRADTSGRQRRVFNGDSAIASRICSMTNEPFATVFLTYVHPMPTKEMVAKNQIFASPTIQYKILQSRLEDANFEVRHWELSKSFDESLESPTTMPAPKNTILIVLPSNVRGEITGDKLTNLKREIDSGTPAVFLTESQIRATGTTPHDTHLNAYLAREWGVSVMSSYVTIPAGRDATDPTKFKIDNLRNRAMPQSHFSSHIIGKGLKGQRLLWRALSTCPIVKIQPATRPGLNVTSLLAVPENQTATWATTRFHELQKQYRTTEGSFIRPNFKAEKDPDLKPPFDLAAAITREGDRMVNEEPNRIVVLGVGASLVDSYLGVGVEVHTENRTNSMADPPAMDADLLVNSVMWLGGLQDRIAAGPAMSKPIDVEPYTRGILMIACTILLPLLVVGAGFGVMFVRKRK